MKKTALFLMLFTIFTQIIGFIRDITLSYFYGTSIISDAYLISQTVPQTVFAFIGSGISTIFVPMYSKIVKENSTQLADKFTNNIINFIIIISTIVVTIVLIFTIPIIKLFASGFEGEALEWAVYFTRISIFGIYFSGIIYVISSYLQIKNKFRASALMTVPLNITVIISIILSVKFSISFLSIGGLIGLLLQLLFLLPFAYKSGYRYKFVLDRHDRYLKNLLKLSVPVIIGVSVYQINILVDRTMASQISSGGITAMTFANRINSVIQGLFVASIATVLYPNISKMVVDNNKIGLIKAIKESIIGIGLLVIPASIISIFFAEPIVKFLFERGSFDKGASSITADPLLFYSVGMIAFGVREILYRVFYSLQDTKTPLINAAISLFINIVLNVILSKYMGLGGLALATSLSGILCTFLLFGSLRKKIGSIGIKSLLIVSIKILLVSILMGVISKLIYNNLIIIISLNLSLIVSIFLGLLIYIVFIYLMKIKEVDNLFIKFKKRIQ
ncbi:murein biosynthesis integral membrane protein MurJ [Neobacillus mesonae]|uniref:Probable lipid II flippase MurJ n=1 Tax=Neobacillus mesonae TaxID=1193713 RepID=A0A3Q9QXH1_9BACI|nr:murein biosynthesis integral membrane protein MurJ [Neobacillus mesonae]AZU64480.1 murein biosynthesis integral membrane protein MurJ [Neobacillus mesonae]